MKYFDSENGKEVTFLDCEGGRTVVDENGAESYLFYAPAREISMEELLRSLPIGVVGIFTGEVGKIMGIEFVKEPPCPDNS